MIGPLSANATRTPQSAAGVSAVSYIHSPAAAQPEQNTAKLGWILIRHRWIAPAQLETALTLQHQSSEKLGELLVQQNLISEVQLKQALREQYWRRNGYWVI